jgi:GDPmannose 4,6-dehydratase
MSIHKEIILEYANLRDLNAVSRVMQKVIPDEIYNLAAQSHV